MEKVVGAHGFEPSMPERERIENVRANRPRRVPRETTGRDRQRALVQVEQRDLRQRDRPRAAVEIPASPDAEIEVAPADVAVVPLQHRPTRAPPDEAIREPEHDEVVGAQHERRVDPLPGFDLGCMRLSRLHAPRIRVGR
jgi:hypothetical protein